MSPTNNSNITSIKVSFNGELRRFPFPIDESVNQFAIISQTIAQSFGIAPTSLVLQYVDDENDTITVGSQLELIAALGNATSAILRLTATAATSTTTPVVVASPQQTPCHPQHPSFGGFRGFHHGHPHHPFGGHHGFPHHQGQQPHSPSEGSDRPHHFGGRWGGHGGRGGRKHCENIQEQYKSQIEELEREGLNHGFWALRILANLNGDVEATKNVIRTRKAAMNDLRTKYALQLEALQSMNLIPPTPVASTTTTTTAAGGSSEGGRCGRGGSEQGVYNHCTRKCIKLLERFNGDVEQVAAHIRHKQTERENMPIRYATQMNQLREQGFWCEPVCLRMLHKFDGDVAKVAERMSKFRRFGPQRHQEQEAATQQYETQLQELVAQGYSRWASARMLRKFDGDSQRVKQALDMRKQWFTTNTNEKGMKDKRQELKAAKTRFADELKQLKEMGFRCKWLLVPLLLEHNGDVGAVSLALA